MTGENGISSNGFERKFRCDLASSSVKILVASTKSSNIAGILWAILWVIPWVILGWVLWVIRWVIRKRLVELRLDFLASPSLVDIPPVTSFVLNVFGLYLCGRRARPC